MNLEAATKSEITAWMKEYDFHKFVKDLDKRADEYKKQEKIKESRLLLIQGGPK